MSSRREIVDPNGRQFSADSFDRFGDDLCELLLSYLSFNDKIRLECVSKQWKRLVYSKQLVLSAEVFVFIIELFNTINHLITTFPMDRR